MKKSIVILFLFMCLWGSSGFCAGNPPVANPPVAEFSATPTSGNAPLTVTFTDQSTNSPIYWRWTFGDGGTSTQQNPTHQYTTAGTYTVSLTATNACGNNTKTKTGYITVNGCTAPVAAFTGTPTSGNAPLTVSFTDSSTNSPTSWSWNFGDSGTSTLQNPSHQYTTAGTYGVSLTATNGCGNDTETKSGYILVSPPNSDSDADGLPDAWEINYFGNLSQSANGDPDSDGVSNGVEYKLGTNPTINDLPGTGIHYQYDSKGRIKKIYRIPTQ